MSRTLAGTLGRTLLGAAILIGCAPGPIRSPLPSIEQSASSGPTMTPAPSPTPVGSVVNLGPLVDGVPSTIEGESVFLGDALTAAVESSLDATPFLVGGWFQGFADIRSCPAFWAGKAITPCRAFDLFADRVGGMPIRIDPVDNRVIAAAAATLVQPVILRVHTHDERCDADGCENLLVLLDVLWQGGVPADSPPPRVIGTPPPTSITEAKAIQRALAESMAHTSPLTVRTITSGPMWAILPAEEHSYGDQWVWAIVFDGQFVLECGERCADSSRSELVILDYLTGAHIMTSVPATPIGPP